MPVIVQPRTAPVSRGSQSDTGTLFMPVVTDRGPVDRAVTCTSFQQWTDTFGGRIASSNSYDCAETFFREGGSRLVCARYVGPAAAIAKFDLLNVSAAATLRVSAKSPGAWGNNLTVEVQAGVGGGTFVLVIRESGTIVETSPDLADEAAAAVWSTGSKYVDCSDLVGTGDPAVVAATALAGGADDIASITDTQRQAALDLFTKGMGPGQVVLPGDTRTAAHTMLRTHAAGKNRHALGDQPDTATVATITGAVATQRSLTNPEAISLWGPVLIAPGVASGTTREIPYSVFQAAKMAATDAQYGHPNEPAAYDRSAAAWITGVKRAYTEAEYDTLRLAGANMGRVIDGVVQTDGYRTVVDPVSAQINLQVSNVRLDMLIRELGRQAAQRRAARQIDGYGRLASAYAADLIGALEKLKQKGAIFPLIANGIETDKGYSVDAGPTVNTPATIQAGELHAVIGVRRSPFAETVYLDIYNRLVTEPV